jgi:hypothetical protein
LSLPRAIHSAPQLFNEKSAHACKLTMCGGRRAPHPFCSPFGG